MYDFFRVLFLGVYFVGRLEKVVIQHVLVCIYSRMENRIIVFSDGTIRNKVSIAKNKKKNNQTNKYWIFVYESDLELNFCLVLFRLFLLWKKCACKSTHFSVCISND